MNSKVMTFYLAVLMLSKSTSSLPGAKTNIHVIILSHYVCRLNLSRNKLEDCNSIQYLSKLKRLWIDSNQLINITFKNLTSLVLLSLQNNNLEILSDMSELKKLIYLNLSHNGLTGKSRRKRMILSENYDIDRVINISDSLAGGFSQLSKLKSLKVLYLSRNNINMTADALYQKVTDPILSLWRRLMSFFLFVYQIISPLMKIPKLRHFFLNGNPVQTKIFKYRLFIIGFLPTLRSLDGIPVTKQVPFCSPSQLDSLRTVFSHTMLLALLRNV